METKKNQKKLKLIWDFRGPEGEHTARHHAIHLQEYAQAQQLSTNITGTEKISETHNTAYMVVTENEMPSVRDALKPHRGQLYAEQ